MAAPASIRTTEFYLFPTRRERRKEKEEEEEEGGGGRGGGKEEKEASTRRKGRSCENKFSYFFHLLVQLTEVSPSVRFVELCIKGAYKVVSLKQTDTVAI